MSKPFSLVIFLIVLLASPLFLNAHPEGLPPQRKYIDDYIYYPTFDYINYFESSTSFLTVVDVSSSLGMYPKSALMLIFFAYDLKQIPLNVRYNIKIKDDFDNKLLTLADRVPTEKTHIYKLLLMEPGNQNLDVIFSYKYNGEIFKSEVPLKFNSTGQLFLQNLLCIFTILLCVIYILCFIKRRKV